MSFNLDNLPQSSNHFVSDCSYVFLPHQFNDGRQTLHGLPRQKTSINKNLKNIDMMNKLIIS